MSIGRVRRLTGPWLFTRLARAALTLGTLLCVLFPESGAAQPGPLALQLPPRSIGPAGMSGRITSIAVNAQNRNHWLIGTASGGLWRTRNAGTTFVPIFDEQPVQSIGAVAIAASDPQRIYVGTGEGNPRNSQSSGNGVYRSLDGGDTWEHLGLEASRNIHRVLVHPENPDLVWLGILGDPFKDSSTRGVYRSADGGKSWTRVLYRDPRSGVADLVADPHNPNRLFAALWDFRRSPWDAQSGGPGSGLFVSDDGGETWEELGTASGLPAKPYGRIGLAFSPSHPARAYALVEATENALYRSNDGGRNWEAVNTETIGSRPFYFAEIHVDSQNPEHVYNLYSRLARSEDGGNSFEVIEDWGREVHADYHAFWIDPEDSNFIIAGTDGGLYWTHDRGENWRFAENLPLGQFYHVTVDDKLPYNVYGGLQDNGTWFGPSEVWNRGGLRNAYWRELAFNDGFDVVLDQEDEHTVYALWQAGMLLRIDTSSGERKTIAPVTDAGELRFNWNAAIAADPFRAGTIYIGSQHIHRSQDRGDNWEIISPDLTTNDPLKQRQTESGGLSIDATGAENHTTITTIAPSGLQRGLLWVGSDDGRIHIRHNVKGGWQDVTGDLGGAPQGSVVRQIVPSSFRPEEAFAVVDNHLRGDWNPYLLHTRNYGRTWQNLTASAPVGAYALSFVQDPVEEKLLFLGTETGLHVSLDRGHSWQAWNRGFPSVSTMDLGIQARERDLVIGTFGRSIWILDDLQPWRDLAARPDLQKESLYVFAPPAAYQVIVDQARGQRLSPDSLFAGDNNAREAVITFWVNNPAAVEVTLTVLRDEDQVYRWTVPVRQGLNRSSWDQQWEGKAIYGPLMSPDLERPLAPPGTYRVLIQALGEEGPVGAAVEEQLELLPDPRVDYDRATYESNHAFRLRLEELQETADRGAKTLSCIEEAIREDVDTDNAERALLESGLSNLWSMLEFHDIQGTVSDSPRLFHQLSKAFYFSHSPYAELTANDRIMVRTLERQTSDFTSSLKDFRQKYWKSFSEKGKGESCCCGIESEDTGGMVEPEYR